MLTTQQLFSQITPYIFTNDGTSNIKNLNPAGTITSRYKMGINTGTTTQLNYSGTLTIMPGSSESGSIGIDLHPQTGATGDAVKIRFNTAGMNFGGYPTTRHIISDNLTSNFLTIHTGLAGTAKKGVDIRGKLGIGNTNGLDYSANIWNQLIIKGSTDKPGTGIDMIPKQTTAGWFNQIRFFKPNATTEELRHLIIDNYDPGVLENNYMGIMPGYNGGTNNLLYIGGRVKIGNVTTPNPTEYMLYVQKGILTEKVKVALSNSANWSDYVFAPDYQLKSLQEVKTFIDENCHLPGIPSAEEVMKEGIDLGAMDAKLLAKVEELTLYIIALNERIEALENANANANSKANAKPRKISQLNAQH